MKKTVKWIVVTLSVVAALALFFQIRAFCMEKIEQQMILEQRLEDVQHQTDMEKQSLMNRIDELMAEKVVTFDAAAVKEQILNIGELATVSYCYTNVGTLDAVKEFSFLPCNIPFSDKHLVISMDGILKAGVDMTKVDIIADESKKTITVTIPNACVLSTELMEETMKTHVEQDSIFSDITTDDSREVRMVITAEAAEKITELGLLEQARDRAAVIIKSLIEAIPGIKDTYRIVIV